jgi:hypothetical protein
MLIQRRCFALRVLAVIRNSGIHYLTDSTKKYNVSSTIRFEAWIVRFMMQ